MEVKAISLLRDALDLLDDVHCYDTDLFQEIQEFLDAIDNV